jgi:hypothetical protein
LEKPAQVIDRNLTYFDDTSRESDVNHGLHAAPAHVDSRLQPSIPREARDGTRRRMATSDDAYARAARAQFGLQPRTLKRLSDQLDIGETKAREMRDEWLGQGWIRETRLGRWQFVEKT